MRKTRNRDLIYLVSGCVVFLILFVLWFRSFNESQGYWEAEIGNAGPHASLTLRLTGGETQPWHRVIVFQNIEANAIQPGRFKLPDEAEQMPGARLTFEDITLRPGHVAFVWQGHEFVIMSNWLRIDGKDFNWNERDEITLVE